MSRFKALSLPVCLGLLAVALPPNAKADEWNKKTILTVNEPISVPGKVLQPGKYVMKLMESPSDRHIVQIYDQDEKQLQTTVIAIPNYRLQPTGKSEFGFWEVSAGQPRPLRSWFYPGDNYGQEFAYPKDVAAQIAKSNNSNVPAVMSGGENPTSAELGTVSPDNADTQTAENKSSETTQSNTETNTTTAQSSTDNSAMAQNTTPAPATPPATDNSAANTTPAPSTPPATDNSTMAQTTPPATSSAQANSTTTTTDQTSSKRLPSTASPFPLVGLGGLMSVASALVFRAVRKRS